ncbi:MAG: M28 family peptidase [Candidatus Thermoplasmatota archaeon]|nr:M28 family peptidase [Candidatus Thermoplasmatota archaeon]MBU1940837.1 M28 family peptidase [Candidatus Thermoplasmatota archaeon]
MKTTLRTKRGISIILIILILPLNISTTTAQTIKTEYHPCNNIDIEYIYNLTAALSNIIFTEYDEEHGEIAKSRSFGTKGEHKAAEILKDNMSALGLYAYYEPLTSIPKHPDLIYKYEILDYQLKIHYNDTDPGHLADCYISHTVNGPRNNPTDINYSVLLQNLSVIQKPRFANPFDYLLVRNQYSKDFVFITEDDSYNPTLSPPPMKQFLGKIFSPYSDPVLFWSWLRYLIEISIWYRFLPHCQGLIRYDFNNHTHNMDYSSDWNLPVIFINGTEGRNLIANLNTSQISYRLYQELNTSVESYNVIGQLNGTDPSKTIIVDSLYDSVWTQGAADSAIGMAIVMSIAKFFADHNITPLYTIKFIGFSGEEYGFRGAYHYEATNKKENIVYVVDLNQLGFTQTDPPLYLELLSNNKDLLATVKNITEFYDYSNVTHQKGVRTFHMPFGAPSNDQPFARYRHTTKTICFLKGLNWYYHHRDGLHHSEGDVLKYFNWTDVALTAQIVLDLIMKISVNT